MIDLVTGYVRESEFDQVTIDESVRRNVYDNHIKEIPLKRQKVLYVQTAVLKLH